METIYTTRYSSVRPGRVQAIMDFGFTMRQARFLVFVLVHSGVFLERQYRAFAGIAHGQKTHDFLHKLVDGGYATAITPGALHRGRLYHVQHKPLYEAIREPDNRNRKRASLGRFVERLMLLDAVLADPRYMWLGTERDKVEFFSHGRMGEPQLDTSYLPHLTFGQPGNQTVRYFPDKLPIGADPNGGRRRVFLYLITREVPHDFRLFLHRHADLFRAVRQWTIRILVPRRLRKAVALYRYAIRDELTTMLRPSTVEELEWLFRVQAGQTATPPDPALTRAAAEKKYAGARFRALRASWEREGHPALRRTMSDGLRTDLEFRDGRIEFVALNHQYLQLGSLVGVA